MKLLRRSLWPGIKSIKTPLRAISFLYKKVRSQKTPCSESAPPCAVSTTFSKKKNSKALTPFKILKPQRKIKACPSFYREKTSPPYSAPPPPTGLKKRARTRTSWPVAMQPSSRLYIVGVFVSKRPSISTLIKSISRNPHLRSLAKEKNNAPLIWAIPPNKPSNNTLLAEKMPNSIGPQPKTPSSSTSKTSNA